MYDTLLDEYDEDARVAVDASNFVASEDDEATVAANNAEASADDEALSEIDDGESWSDDPVRMYLTQMGEIPLLTRHEEITLAKRIEDTRRQFRTKLLECNYVIQQAFKVIKRVHEGELP
ncbi:MAG: sigma-70 factor domain-containing protein, partial [Planctomycetota bacterium]|nr:sigma-70 factor domain-containing protein [Planctomycetota bacterium]